MRAITRATGAHKEGPIGSRRETMVETMVK
jgi:hypothetical protein